jgi:hypothetical protein
VTWRRRNSTTTQRRWFGSSSSSQGDRAHLHEHLKCGFAGNGTVRVLLNHRGIARSGSYEAERRQADRRVPSTVDARYCARLAGPSCRWASQRIRLEALLSGRRRKFCLLEVNGASAFDSDLVERLQQAPDPSRRKTESRLPIILSSRSREVAGPARRCGARTRPTASRALSGACGARARER